MIENTISIDSTDVLDTAQETMLSETKVQKTETAEQENTGFSETEETAENDLISTAETAEDASANQQETTVELTVYGEKHRVPLSQAVAAAQKGMAFDHIKNQLADLKNDYRIKALDQMAERSGTTTYQLVAQLQHQMVAADILSRFGDFASAPLDELGRAVETLTATNRQLAESKAQNDYHSWKTQLAEFMAENPGLKDIPQEVIESARKGENLSAAYSRIYGNKLEKELKEAKLELDVLKSESKAVKGSMPSAKSTGGDIRPKENEYLKLMKSTW